MEKHYLDLRALQQADLNLMLSLKELLDEYHITWALCGGTMLGAARHAGFIPWDDDIDIMMLRDEYERFVALAPEINERSSRYALVSWHDGSFARDYARFIDKKYAKDEEDVAAHDCPWLGIDIFPIDHISDDQSEFEQQVHDRAFWKEVMTTCSSPFNAGSTALKKMVRNVFRPVAKAIGGLRAAQKSEAICRRFEHAGGSDIAIVCGMYGTKERWPLASYEPLAELPFEGHMLPVPHDWDTYMRAIYGDDYMQLPPEDKRRPQRIHVWEV